MSSSNRSRFNPLLVYVDFLFNINKIFAILFVIFFLLIRPIAESTNPETKNVETTDSIFATLEWNPESSYDIDIHLKLPNGSIVNFRSKDSNEASLERDDLGTTNDSYIVAEETKVLKLNREIIHIRSLSDGLYVFNIHFYKNMNNEQIPLNLLFDLQQFIPDYKILYHENVEALGLHEEKTILSFEVVDGKIVTKMDDLTQIPFVIDQASKEMQ